MNWPRGCRNKSELERLKKGLAQHNTEVLPVTELISKRAMLLIDLHALSDGLQLGDAFIAVTTLEHRLTLITSNVKHFHQIEGLAIERFDPTGSVQ